MKRFVSALLTLALLLGLAMPASAAKAKAAVMRLQLAEGSVTVRDAAGVPVRYSTSMRLYSGYAVSTGDDSSAYILLDDAKAVKLDRNTSVVIKKSGRKLQVKLKAGQLIFNVSAPLQSSESMEIRTSSMVVGILGSSGVVSTKEVVFVTGHGVVYYGKRSYAISGGQGFRPESGVYTAPVSSLPSLYLKEVRDNSQLRSRIRSENVYDPEELISAIPAAEEREDFAYWAALDDLEEPPADKIIPAFKQGSEEPEPVTYTITWVSDGNTLGTTSVNKGETPVWSGDTPTKAADAQYSYTFAGWTPEIVPATEDTVYTAEFTKTKRNYTVTWKDDAGNVIGTENVAYGETPSHAAPTKANTETATYEFTGWDPQPAAVNGNATYTAVFEATYDFAAIIPQGSDNTPYYCYFPTEGNTPITKAKEGETFTFYLGGTDDASSYRISLNGRELGEQNVYYSKEMDAVVCTFTVPKDPVIEIEPSA